jgi:hypothetical protein
VDNNPKSLHRVFTEFFSGWSNEIRYKLARNVTSRDKITMLTKCRYEDATEVSPVVDPSRKWDDNKEIYLKNTLWGIMYWFDLSGERELCCTFVSIPINLGFRKCRVFLPKA